MTQNTSPAVMAQRKEPLDALDDFPTMPWGTRALMEHVIVDRLFSRPALWGMTCWEPSANRGHMVKPLKEYFDSVLASDVHDYGCNFPVVHDFLSSPRPNGFSKIDMIITNPPFRLAKQFIKRGLEFAMVGVAVIVRTSFLESVNRYQDLYRDTPPTIVAPFVERIPMFKGHLNPSGSSATSYTWLVWIKGVDPLPVVWIPPCRKVLEQTGDYVSSAQGSAA